MRNEVEQQKFVVFYSWQSDLAGRANRSLIEDALEAAAKNLRADESLEVQPVMDRDTAGIAGAPDIAATIFEKIDKANAFVADVSFITSRTSKRQRLRPCPNPNVLLELGYALHRHGWDRVLLVFNEHYGSIADLPFDLRGRRVLAYRSSPDDSDRATPKRILQARLSDELRRMAAVPFSKTKSKVDEALEAIAEARPTRRTNVRKAIEEATSELEAVAPNLDKPAVESAAFIQGLDASTPAIVGFLGLADSAAVVDDRETALSLVRGLERVAVHCDLPPRFSGSFWPWQFDYWRHVSYELVLGLIGCFLREGRFETIGEVLRTRLHLPNVHGRQEGQVRLNYLNAKTWSQQDVWGQKKLVDGRRYIDPVGVLLKERYSASPLSDVITWPEIQASDLLLMMWAIKLPPEDLQPHPQWIAHAAALMDDSPRFLTDAIRVGPARALAQAIGVTTPEALRELYLDRTVKEILGQFPNIGRMRTLQFSNAHKIGTEP